VLAAVHDHPALPEGPADNHGVRQVLRGPRATPRDRVPTLRRGSRRGVRRARHRLRSRGEPPGRDEPWSARGYIGPRVPTSALDAARRDRPYEVLLENKIENRQRNRGQSRDRHDFGEVRQLGLLKRSHAERDGPEGLRRYCEVRPRELVPGLAEREYGDGPDRGQRQRQSDLDERP